jgi:peroxiredoxin Q/BCP
MIKPGSKAPNFDLPDEDNKHHSLSDFAGKWLLLYFYPKDDTPGCTVEACSFRDAQEKFSEIGASIVGISTDSVASHKKFAQKHALPFTLLSDSEKKTVSDYGVWEKKKFMGREYMGIVRSSFLINKEGIVQKVYEKVNPLTHTSEVLKDIEDFNKTA